MAQFGWNDCPGPVRAQVEGTVRALREEVGDGLLGVYLHGSLAMGCFNPAESDLDLLALTAHRLALETRRALIESWLAISRHPTAIEISVVRLPAIQPWRYPTPYDLHYSEHWRERYQEDLASEQWRAWGEGEEPLDEDLAAHITITRQRGIVLWGEPIESAFSEVPASDYRASLRADLEWTVARLDTFPVYAVLNACRIIAFNRERSILSKDEGGGWGLEHLPEKYACMIRAALEYYRGNVPCPVLPEDEVGSLMQLASKSF